MLSRNDLVALKEGVDYILLDHRQPHFKHAFIRVKFGLCPIFVDFERKQLVQNKDRALDHQHLSLDVQLHVFKSSIRQPDLDENSVAVVGRGVLVVQVEEDVLRSDFLHVEYFELRGLSVVDYFLRLFSDFLLCPDHVFGVCQLFLARGFFDGLLGGATTGSSVVCLHFNFCVRLRDLFFALAV